MLTCLMFQIIALNDFWENEMGSFKRDLIIHWLIYNISVVIFIRVAFLVSSLKAVPVWVLGVSLTAASCVLFGFQAYWLWLKLKDKGRP